MTRTTKPGVLTTKLKVAERLRLLGVLPPQGGLATIRLVRDLRERLSLQEEEIERLNVKVDEGLVRWSVEKDKGREFSFTGFEIELVVSSLRKLDKEEKMTPDLIPLWDIFVDGKAEEKVPLKVED